MRGFRADMPKLHVRRFRRRRSGGGSREHLAALILHLLDFFLDGGDDVIQFLDIFEKIGDVQEGVAIEADIYESRLHAGKHARYTAFVDASN